MILREFVLLFPLVQLTTCGTGAYRCNSPDPKLFDHMTSLGTGTYGGSNNCYFVVKGASFMVPGPKNASSDDRFVDLDRGRIICFAHDATLPMILTESEQEFLNREYANAPQLMLLSLERITYNVHIWDNNRGLAFKPKVWNSLPVIPGTTGTYTLLATNDGRWTEYFPNKAWSKSQPFSVVCEQRLYIDGKLPGNLGWWHPNYTVPKNFIWQSDKLTQNGSGKVGVALPILAMVATLMIAS